MNILEINEIVLNIIDNFEINELFGPFLVNKKIYYFLKSNFVLVKKLDTDILDFLGRENINHNYKNTRFNRQFYKSSKIGFG